MPGSVTNWLLRGDDEAACRIWERYVHKLLTLARQDLHRAVRTRVDEEDVVQSAFESYFRRHGDYQLAGRDDLWSLLVTITLNKVRNANRHHLRHKRDARRDRSTWQLPGNAPEAAGAGSVFELQSDEAPTPEEAVALVEELEGRLRELEAAGDPDLPRVARMKLEGYANREIAAALRLTERSIERKLGRIRNRWAEAEGARSCPHGRGSSGPSHSGEVS
jgi:RNA polymerase sigma-70 factor (ECF subfamily)